MSLYVTECLDPGQEIPVQLIERSTGGERWLHSGGVQCPRCEALCEDCSQQTGESQVTGPGPELDKLLPGHVSGLL